MRRQTPRTADGPGKRLGPELQLEEGRALGRAGDGAWDPLVRAGRAEGRFDDELVDGLAGRARLGARAGPALGHGGAVAAHRRAGPRLRGAAADRLGLPCVELLERAGDDPPQREMANAAQQVGERARPVPRARRRRPGPGLLVDDLWFSGGRYRAVALAARWRGPARCTRWSSR